MLALIASENVFILVQCNAIAFLVQSNGSKNVYVLVQSCASENVYVLVQSRASENVYTLLQSCASACKKIEEGDEIVNVDGHTVVSVIK